MNGKQLRKHVNGVINARYVLEEKCSLDLTISQRPTLTSQKKQTAGIQQVLLQVREIEKDGNAGTNTDGLPSFQAELLEEDVHIAQTNRFLVATTTLQLRTQS